MIAALFVELGGVYYGLPEVDPYDSIRDARTYNGPYSVIAHPPCQRWSILAHSVQGRYGIPIKQDNGTFLCALRKVIAYGGVLEHPAQTMAWEHHGIAKPERGKWKRAGIGWTCEVAQSAYGHLARKLTWLFYVGNQPPFDLDWSAPRGTHQVSRDTRGPKARLPELTKKQARSTPIAFRDVLIRLAMHSEGA